jgi:hypothetical protein
LATARARSWSYRSCTAYIEGVETAFGSEVDYAQLQKVYAEPSVEGQRRYSPLECVGLGAGRR